MTLRECIEKHTNREMLTWMAYFGDEWNDPDRSDHYAMQVALEVRRVLHKTPGSIKLEDMKIPFVPIHGKDEGKVKKATPEEREEATKIAKAAWGTRLAGAVKKATGLIPLGKKNGD